MSVDAQPFGLTRWRLALLDVAQEHLGGRLARASDVRQLASGDVEDGEPAVEEFDFECVFHGLRVVDIGVYYKNYFNLFLRYQHRL